MDGLVNKCECVGFGRDCGGKQEKGSKNGGVGDHLRLESSTVRGTVQLAGLRSRIYTPSAVFGSQVNRRVFSRDITERGGRHPKASALTNVLRDPERKAMNTALDHRENAGRRQSNGSVMQN